MAERLGQLVHVAVERDPVISPDPVRDMELVRVGDGVETVRGKCHGDEPLIVHLSGPYVGGDSVSGLDDTGTPL